MDSLFSIENWFALMMIIMLQAVLGFDNLLYISIEANKVEPSKRSMVRKVGLAIAIGLRLILLFVLVKAIALFQAPFFTMNWVGVIEGEVNFHALIVLVGGVFILYTAIQEIFHMISITDYEEEAKKSRRTVTTAIFWIVAMNLVFSFDTILATIALTDVFWVMAVGVITTGIGMILLADRVAEFLEKNRMYQVLGLFVLMLVGILLVSEGGHLSNLKLLGYDILPMAKSTFYFVLFVMVAVDLVQGRYKKKLMKERAHIEKLAMAAKKANLEV